MNAVKLTNTCNDCRHCRKAIWKDAGWVSNAAFGTCLHNEVADVQFVYRTVPLGSTCPMHSPGESVAIPEVKTEVVTPKRWWWW